MTIIIHHRTSTHEQYIHHLKDHVLADLISTCQLQRHFSAGRFWEKKIGSWIMKCVGTEKLEDQRKHVTLEHISGDNKALTRKYQREKCSLSVSSLTREARDVSIRAAIKINHPTANTLTGYLPFCKV